MSVQTEARETVTGVVNLGQGALKMISTQPLLLGMLILAVMSKFFGYGVTVGATKKK